MRRRGRHEPVVVAVQDQDGHRQLVRPGDHVELAEVDRLLQTDHAVQDRGPEEPLRDLPDGPRQLEHPALRLEHLVPVDDGRLQDDAVDHPGEARADEGLQHDRTAHRPPHEHDAPGVPGGEPAEHGVDVLPFGGAEPVAAVGAPRCDAVVPPRREHDRVPGGAEHGHGADGLGAGDTAAVHEDGPRGVGVVGTDDPGRRGPVRGGDVDVLDGHVELAGVQVEPAAPASPSSGGRVAGVDGDDAPRDGRLGRAEDLADPHVPGPAAEPQAVAALELGVGGAFEGHGHPVRVDRVDRDTLGALPVGGDDGPGDGGDEPAHHGGADRGGGDPRPECDEAR
ncbi:hypothetical protein Cus16_0510 [Curtobacterium sp. ER1/6]|nr:hypothetical protein Cus16_0510 [Curtobacterium sp. ER1/6]